MKLCCSLAVLVLACFSLQASQAIPINTDMIKFKEDADDGTTKMIEVHSTDKNMEKTIDDLYGKLKRLDVKAVYKKRVMLKQLVNGTGGSGPAGEEGLYPEYVLTREDKIYFFTSEAAAAKAAQDIQNGAGATDDDAENDRKMEQLQSLLQISKKHTNNGPGLGKKSLDSAMFSAPLRLETPPDVGEQAPEKSPSAAARADGEEGGGPADLEQMISSLQLYVKALQRQLDSAGQRRVPS